MKILTILFILISVVVQAQINYYPINAGQYAIYTVGAGDSVTVDTKYASGGVIAYRNHVEVVDTIFKVPKTASLDTLSNFTRPAGKKAAIALERGGHWRSSITVPDDSISYVAYGSGAKPIINGADNDFTWTPDYSIVSEADTTYPAQSTDDVFLRDGNFFQTNTTYLAFGNMPTNTTSSDSVAIRFTNVQIAKDANIVSAVVRMTAENNKAGAFPVTIYGEDNVTPSTFSTWTDYLTRNRTTASVAWTPPSFTKDVSYNTPDISTIITELTSNASWVSGNDIVIFIDNDLPPVSGAVRTIYSYDNGSKFASLIINSGVITAIDNNIYSIPYTEGEAIVLVDDTLYTKVATRAELAAHTFYINTTADSLSIYTEIDPATRNIEVSIRNQAMSIGNSNITLSSIGFKNHSYAGVRFLNNSDNNIVTNCDFYYNHQSGLSFYNGCDNNVIKYCTSEHNGNGFYSNLNCNDNTFSHNTANYNRRYINGASFTDGHGFGIFYSSGNVVEYCTATDNSYNLNSDPGGGVSNITIRYNYFSNPISGVENLGVGGVAAGGIDSVYYNVFTNSTPAGGGMGGIGGDGQLHIYNNTIYTNSSDNWGWGAYFSNPDNITFKNNLIYNTSSNSGNNAFMITSGVLDDFISNNNLFYMPNGTNAFKYLTTNYTSLGDWQTATNQDANSVEADPLFTDSANGNFTLQAGSPAINAGADVGLTKDILGNPIVGNPDIGAYEKQE